MKYSYQKAYLNMKKIYLQKQWIHDGGASLSSHMSDYYRLIIKVNVHANAMLIKLMNESMSNLDNVFHITIFDALIKKDSIIHIYESNLANRIKGNLKNINFVMSKPYIKTVEIDDKVKHYLFVPLEQRIDFDTKYKIETCFQSIHKTIMSTITPGKNVLVSCFYKDPTEWEPHITVKKYENITKKQIESFENKALEVMCDAHLSESIVLDKNVSISINRLSKKKYDSIKHKYIVF